MAKMGGNLIPAMGCDGLQIIVIAQYSVKFRLNGYFSGKIDMHPLGQTGEQLRYIAMHRDRSPSRSFYCFVSWRLLF